MEPAMTWYVPVARKRLILFVISGWYMQCRCRLTGHFAMNVWTLILPHPVHHTSILLGLDDRSGSSDLQSPFPSPHRTFRPSGWQSSFVSVRSRLKLVFCMFFLRIFIKIRTRRCHIPCKSLRCLPLHNLICSDLRCVNHKLPYLRRRCNCILSVVLMPR